jgi:hypothetical protein
MNQRLIILWTLNVEYAEKNKQIALERHRFMETLLHSFTRNGMESRSSSSDAACIFWFIIVIYNLLSRNLKGLFYLSIQ